MKKFLIGIAAVIGLFVLADILFYAGMSFADGPWGPVRGGEFSSGELVTTEPDWSFVKERMEVEFQLLDPVSSRTTWIVEHNGRVFIPCGYMDSTLGRLWKHWPLQAEQDGRAILRIDNDLYNRTLRRVKEDPALDQILAELGRKYMGGPVPREAVMADSLWIFELLPR